jgi:hypothetical protein
LLFTHPSFSIIEEAGPKAPKAMGITQKAAKPAGRVRGCRGSNGVVCEDIVASLFGETSGNTKYPIRASTGMQAARRKKESETNILFLPRSSRSPAIGRIAQEMIWLASDAQANCKTLLISLLVAVNC